MRGSQFLSLTLFFLIFLLAESLFAKMEKTVRAGGFYETNTFYSDESPKGDFAIFIEPTLKTDSYVSGTYNLQTESSLNYEKHLSQANQDYFTYDLKMNNFVKPSWKFQYYINPFIKSMSEPALSKKSKRLGRNFMGSDLGFVVGASGGSSYIVNLQIQQERLNQNQYAFLDNFKWDGRFYYKSYFLPETYSYFGLRIGQNSFPKGQKSAVYRNKYNSQRIEPGVGIEGRLSKTMKIRSYIGYPFLTYTKHAGYQNPVVLLEFEEDISLRDLVLLGFHNTAEDAYSTNYVQEQKIFFGYGRFLRDRLLAVSKAEYVFRIYGMPYVRNDQRFVIHEGFEYSYSSNIKVEGSFSFDLFSSDAVNKDGPPDPIDPSASYRNIKGELSLRYIF